MLDIGSLSIVKPYPTYIESSYWDEPVFLFKWILTSYLPFPPSPIKEFFVIGWLFTNTLLLKSYLVYVALSGASKYVASTQFALTPVLTNELFLTGVSSSIVVSVILGVELWIWNTNACLCLINFPSAWDLSKVL